MSYFSREHVEANVKLKAASTATHEIVFPDFLMGSDDTYCDNIFQRSITLDCLTHYQRIEERSQYEHICVSSEI